MKKIVSMAFVGVFLLLSILTTATLSEGAYVYMDGYQGIDDNCRYTGAGDWVIKANETDGAFEIHTGTDGSVSFLIEDWVIGDGWWNVTYEFPTNTSYTKLLFWAPSSNFGNGFFSNSTGDVGWVDASNNYLALDNIAMDTKHLLTYYINTTDDTIGARFNETSTFHWLPFKTAVAEGDVDDYIRAFSWGSHSWGATIKIYNVSHNPDNLEAEHFQLSPPPNNDTYNYTLVYDVDNITQLKDTNPHADTSSLFTGLVQNAWATNGTYNMMLGDTGHGAAEYYVKQYFPLDPRDAWDYCNQSDTDELTIQIRIDLDRTMNVSSGFRWMEQNNTPSSIHADYMLENANYTDTNQIWTNITINGTLAEQFFNIANFTAAQEHFIYIYYGNNRTGGTPSPWHVANIGTRTNYDGRRWYTFDSFGPTAFDNVTFDIQGYITTDAPQAAPTVFTPVRFEDVIDILVSVIPVLIVLGASLILFRVFMSDKEKV